MMLRSKRSRTPNLYLLEDFIDLDFIVISDDEDERVFCQKKKRKKQQKEKKKDKGKKECEGSEQEDEDNEETPGTPPLSLRKTPETLKEGYMRALGVRIQIALRQNLRKQGNHQTCSIELAPMCRQLWEMIVASFSGFGHLIVQKKTLRGLHVEKFSIYSQEHLIFLQPLLGKHWWQVEEVLLGQEGDESPERKVFIGTLSVSFYRRNKQARSGASKFPISFCFHEKKAALRIGIAVYYQTEGGDITRGSKENHYSAHVTERQNTQQEQQDEDEFFAGFN
jgi:hypothetical protein